MENYLNKNLRNESKLALKQANVQWANCIAQNFLPQWLAGANLNVTEVCTEKLTKMNESDAENYPGTLSFKAPQ